MAATLGIEEKVFLSSLNDEDRQLNIGGVYNKLEHISCGLDVCTFMCDQLSKLRNDVCIRFLEERTRNPPSIVHVSLEQIDMLSHVYVEEYGALRIDFDHYNHLLQILKQKEIIDRLNRKS